MGKTHCWTFRYEAMGFSDQGDAIVALGRDGLEEIWCLSGRPAELTEYDRNPDDPKADPWELADPLGDLCMKWEGHEGDHEFEAQDSIVVEFAP